MRLTADDVDRFLDGFVAFAEHKVASASARPSVRDPDDEIFAALALTGQADALVSFNIRDYRPADPAKPPLAVPVCRPGDILRRLPWRP